MQHCKEFSAVYYMCMVQFILHKLMGTLSNKEYRSKCEFPIFSGHFLLNERMWYIIHVETADRRLLSTTYKIVVVPQFIETSI